MADSKTVVLVADDEPSTLAMVSAHLRSRGYTVHEASDGDQAWELAHEHLPDLVVLDVMMPGMGGWELCKRIREAVSLAHTGVIMLTGIGDTLNEMTSPLYGADAYVDKPFEFANLDRKIESTLARRRDGALGRPTFEEDGADSGPGGRPGLAKAKPKRRPKGTSALPSQLSLPNTKAASGSGAPRGVPAKPKPVAPKAAKQKKKAAAKPKPVPAKKAPKKASTKPIKKAPKKAPAKPKPVAAKKATKKAPAKPIKKAAKKAPAKPIKKAPKKTARKAAMPKKKTGGKSKKR